MNGNDASARLYPMSPFSSSLAPERASAPSPFRIDEGFSEDTRSENGSPDPDLFMLQRQDGYSARQWLLAQSVEFRAAIARELLQFLPNSVVSDIIHEANGRLHFDPVLCLPNELISDIFGYLDPDSLLNAASVSKSWRKLAMEPLLWRRLFGREGWTHDRGNVRSFEDNSRLQIEKLWSNPRRRPRPSDFEDDRMDVKRARLSRPGDQSNKNMRLWVEHGSLAVPPEWTEDIQIPKSNGKENKRPFSHAVFDEDEMMHDIDRTTDDHRDAASVGNIREQTMCPLLTPSRLIDTLSESPRSNWHWIFKQRRRLEQNWKSGRFTNFRLPRLDHKDEGHTQCVYTLQFSLKYVVSGSRDKTVRVWNLETQRLKMPPLVGHSGSVLCLQFDESPSRDLIVSGSSDADVMIWQFSTGKLIKRLRRAHAESVLNLRFDDRYLVTCSKDKTIKLWNMNELRPSDAEYPRQNKARNARYPDYIIDLAQVINLREIDTVEPLPPYSLIMTLEGHNAAVNAIQIFENHIVSASGDRKIILWDIQGGTLVRVFGGHLKGIACVQYDGRRIVSGSSDNTVRIFDSATGAELAKLDGHSHLVRTVQAEFGDMYDDADVLESEARQNDRRILEDKARLPSTTQSSISASPQRHFVFGAKLPPGGGGNKWSKIVSGSYDQSVIIWRRDKEGSWKIAKQLRQEDALRATAGDSPELVNVDGGATVISSLSNVQDNQSQGLPTLQKQGTPEETEVVPDIRPFVQHPHIFRALSGQQQQRTEQESFAQQHMSSNLAASAGSSVIPPALSAVNANANITSSRHSHNQHMPQYSNLSARPSELRQVQNHITASQPRPQPQGHTPAHLNPQSPYFVYQPPPHFAPLMQHHHQHRLLNSPPEIPPNLPTLHGPVLDPPTLLARHAAAFREAANDALERDASRVFKLQFDARRIISSSQLPVIVGWDFANGDRDIEEASQFFGEPM